MRLDHLLSMETMPCGQHGVIFGRAHSSWLLFGSEGSRLRQLFVLKGQDIGLSDALQFSGSASPAGDDGIRTHDPLLAGQVLSQLSYPPTYLIPHLSECSPKIEQQIRYFSGPSVFEVVIPQDDSP